MFFLFLPFFVFLNPTSIPHRSRESHPWLREAVPYFDKAIELNPKNARAYGDRGSPGSCCGSMPTRNWTSRSALSWSQPEGYLRLTYRESKGKAHREAVTHPIEAMERLRRCARNDNSGESLLAGYL